MAIFSYGEKEINHLKTRDRILGAAIDRIGFIQRPVIPDLFPALVNAIVGQQISMKAWDTVWKRMLDRFNGVTSPAIFAAPVEDIQKCGITMRKAICIKDIAGNIENGVFDLHALADLDDGEVCRQLTSLKGIGLWTAEMVMIFSMERPDVFSWNDLAIHRGIRTLYRHRTVTKKLFEKYRKRYSPCCTVASLYLWEIAGGALDRPEGTGA